MEQPHLLHLGGAGVGVGDLDRAGAHLEGDIGGRACGRSGGNDLAVDDLCIAVDHLERARVDLLFDAVLGLAVGDVLAEDVHRHGLALDRINFDRLNDVG